MPARTTDIELPSQGQPATWDDYIRYEATRQKVSPDLALAVARKESSLNPNAVGDGGQAIGMFQLHPAAAKDVNANRSDPLENIRGGISYLKQLNDRYGGDVNKTLQAYNGGMDTVDKGTVSPAAQAYAASVIADISKGLRTTAQPTSAAAPIPSTRAPIAGRGTATTNVATQAKTNALDFTRAYDPRTVEGRENLAGTAGSIALAAATRGMPVGALTTRVASIVGPVLGAAAAGSGERAAEETVGAAPSEPGSVTSAGLRQGAYDLAGQAFWWPVRRFFRTLIAPKVAGAAAEGLRAETTAIKAAGRQDIDLVRQEVNDVARTVKQASQAQVGAAKTAAGQQTAVAKQAASFNLAKVELEHADQLREIEKQYDNLLNQPPSTTGAAAAVKSTVEGPSKRALDLAGQRVAEAAETGPEIDITPMIERIDDMVGQTRPDIIFGQGGQAAAIGFGGIPSVSARPVGATAGERISLDEYKKLVAGKLGLSESHPLPGLLGRIQAIQDPTHVSFAEAHQIKRLLDEAVSWDRFAKRHLERLTKGARITLRQTMAAAGHQPYEDATAAYQAVIPLYRRGIGKQIIQLSQAPEGAARVAQMLKSDDPISARTLQQLLVDQSAAGGDPALGQKAWDAVRSSYTYDKVLSGGIKNLGERVNQLLTERPEFVKVVYGDANGKQILHNLAALGEAFSHAEGQAAEQIATQKAAGQTMVSGVKSAGSKAVESATKAAERQVEQARIAGSARVRGAVRSAQEANAKQAERGEMFKQSTLSKFTRRTVEEEGADALRAASLGLHSYWGGLSLLRLMRSPAAPDLLQWMSYSSQNTQRAVKILTSPVPPTVAAAFFKDIYNAFPPPAESK